MAVLPVQKSVPPLIAPGADGLLFTTTVSVCGNEFPHELEAITETIPPVAPDVAVIELVVEFPVQPFGSVHV